MPKLTNVDSFYLDRKSESSGYSCSFKVMTGNLTQSVVTNRMLGLGYGHCISYLNNRILTQDTVIGCFRYWRDNYFAYFLYHGKTVFCLLPHLWIGVYKHMKNKYVWIQCSLGLPPDSVLWLCLFLLCLWLFNLSNISSSHAQLWKEWTCLSWTLTVNLS